MPTIAHTTLLDLGDRLFQAAGVPADQAKIAINHLVEANLMGHDSHGIMRMTSYARSLRKGDIQPVGNHKVVRETPASLTIDADRSFGKSTHWAQWLSIVAVTSVAWVRFHRSPRRRIASAS